MIKKCPYCFEYHMTYKEDMYNGEYLNSPLYLMKETKYDDGVYGFKYQCQNCRLTFELRTRNLNTIWIFNENLDMYSDYLEFKGYYIIPTKNIISDRKTRNGILIEPIDRNKILREQKYKCVYCGKDLKHNEKHLDHIVPVAKGGAEIQENMQYLCRECNIKKKDEISEEWNNVELYNSLKDRGLLHYHLKNIR